MHHMKTEITTWFHFHIVSVKCAIEAMKKWSLKFFKKVTKVTLLKGTKLFRVALNVDVDVF